MITTLKKKKEREWGGETETGNIEMEQDLGK